MIRIRNHESVTDPGRNPGMGNPESESFKVYCHNFHLIDSRFYRALPEGANRDVTPWPLGLPFRVKEKNPASSRVRKSFCHPFCSWNLLLLKFDLPLPPSYKRMTTVLRLSDNCREIFNVRYNTVEIYPRGGEQSWSLRFSWLFWAC